MRAIPGLPVEVRSWLLLCMHRAATGDELISLAMQFIGSRALLLLAHAQNQAERATRRVEYVFASLPAVRARPLRVCARCLRAQNRLESAHTKKRRPHSACSVRDRVISTLLTVVYHRHNHGRYLQHYSPRRRVRVQTTAVIARTVDIATRPTAAT